MTKKLLKEYLQPKQEKWKKRGTVNDYYTVQIIHSTLSDKKEGQQEIYKYSGRLLGAGFKRNAQGFWMYDNIFLDREDRIMKLLAEINKEIHENGGVGVSDDNYQAVMNAIEETLNQIKGAKLPVEDEEKIRNRLEDIAASLADSVNEREATQFIESLFNFSDKLSEFHEYSFQNTLLIYAQEPNATRVAAKSTWKSFNREVIDINKSITINCNNKYYRNARGYEEEYKPKQQKADNQWEIMLQQGTLPSRTTPSQIESHKKNIAMRRNIHKESFDPCPVYDYSNTTGDELPEPQQQQTDITNIYGDNNNDPNANALFAIAKKSLGDEGITVTQDPATAGERGWSRNGQINVSSGVGGTEAASIIFDEWGHDLLHHQGNIFYQEAEKYFKAKGGSNLTSTHIEQIKRVQAQTVAAVLCKFYGLPTSFHPKYMQLLQAQGGLESKQLILENLGTIRDVSNHIVNKIKKYESEFDTTQHQTQQQPEQ